MTTTKSPAYGVTWVSAMSGTRKTINLHTKAQALAEARQLYRDGAKFIDAFKFSPNIGAVSFNWRKF